ncbi:mannosyl-oligosaccharide glucosidase GCS1-like [Macadamia integrifolia]|uniref:mannosyl-oligosaccharide glucosidase GCS1-like n=1 Tax=Macadamia integrifolia TaxID=60698 RepID=UPI001C4EF4E7|nr:mannosyl-oligosaccharide glucosidase GCS1-like [Macadamia integrifolia]
MTGSSRRPARSRIKPTANTGSDDYPSDRKSIQRSRNDRSRGHDAIRVMDVNPKTLLLFGSFAFLIVISVIYYSMKPVEEVQKLRVITPFPAPKVMDLPQFQGEHKESLYWGTYRPHVYFGVRARTPQSLIAGLMWIGVKDGSYVMRHVCQDSDELSTYGWTHHNGRDYGHQVLVDQGMSLMTSFLKTKGSGSGYGGDWAVHINVQNEKSQLEEERTAHIFFYLADEGGKALSIDKERLDIRDGSRLTFGSHEDFGGWELHLVSADNLEVHYSGFRTPHMHNLTELVQGSLADHARRVHLLQLPDASDVSPNILVFQISGKIPFQTDIAFVSGTGLESSRVEERVKSLTGSLLTSQLNEKQKEFEEKYRSCFNLTEKVDSESMIVGMAAIGNLLGGIGYFYGQSKIALPRDLSLNNGDNFVPYWPAELYTAVPSRPFFPRGFLWDEGFHQLLIWRWDIRICLDIIGHWLDLMNIDGWIPREQILGAEALSKVPKEFVPQHPTNGNPPTLFLVLRDLVHGMIGNKFTTTESNEISSFLERAFVRLEAWFQWFNATQSGKDTSTFYWHGRDKQTTRELNPKSLSSGLDDYPRASHPSEDERHLDLRCWMLLAADCMSSMAELLEKKNDFGKGYHTMAQRLSDFDILNRMHFDDVYGAYFDFGNHTEKVRLSWQETNPSGSSYASRELVREVLEKPQLRLVPHIGYISLFPFMMRIIPPESWILEKQLDLISNRGTLWTDYGLRSLAKTSSLYMKRNTEHDPPYWRGPIWMNMNYMILSALHHYSSEDGPYRARARTVYKELRENLIRNVVKNYFQTGFLWEQYDQKKGKGKGAHPFTGWTSLIVLVMGESFCEDLSHSIR